MPVPSYAETVTVVLAALTIMLGFLALLVAVLAIWGYRGIKDEATGAAVHTANDAVDRILNQAVIEKIDPAEITRIVKKEMRLRMHETRIKEALGYAQAFGTDMDQPGETGHIGNEYPESKPDES